MRDAIAPAERANRLRHGGHSPPPLVFSSPSSHPPHPPHPSTHLLLPFSVQPLIHLPFPTQLHLYRVGAATPPLLSNLQSLPTSNFSQIQPRRIASHRIASHQLPTSQWPLYNKQTQLVCNSGGEDVDAAMAVIVVAEEEGGNRSATLPIPHYSTPLPTPQTTLHATSLLITTPSSSPPSSNQPPSGHLTSRTFKLTQHHDAALRPEAGLELTRVRVAERANRLRHGGHSPPPLVFSSPSSHPPHPPHPSTHLLLPSSVQPLIHLPFPTQLHLYRVGAATPPLLSNLQSLPTSNFSQIQPRRIASHRIASHQLPTSQWPLYNKQTQLVCNSGGEDVDAAMAVIVVAEEEGGNRSATLPIPHYSTPLPTPQTTLHATSLLITTPSSSPPSSNQPPSGHLTSRTFKLTQHHDAALRPEAGLELTRVRVAERANRLRHGGHSSPPLVFSSPSSHPPHPPHPSTHLLLPSSVQPLIHLPFPTQLHLYRGGAATPPLLSNLQSLPTSNFSQIQPRRIASHRIASHQLPTSQWPLYNKQTQLVCNSGGEDVDAAMAVIVVAEEEGGNRSATLPIPHYSTPLPTPQTTLHATSLLITTPSSSPPSSNQPPSGHLTSRTFKLTQHHDAALRPEAGLELTRVRVAERANRLRHGGHSPPPLVFSSPSSHPPHPPHPSTHLLLPFSVQPLIHLPFPTQLHLYRVGAATPPLLSNLQSLPTSNFSQIQPRRIASHRIASHQLPTSQWPLYNKQTQLVCNSGGEDVDAAMAVIVVAEEEGGNRSATLPIPHYSTPLPTPQTTLHATSLLITTPSSSPPSSNQPPSGHLTSRTFKLTQHHDAALRPEAGLELTRVRVAERANRLRHGGHSPPPLVFSSPSSHPPHPPHPSTHLLLPFSVQPLIHLPFPTQLHLYRVGAATPPLLSNLQSLPTSNFSQIQPRRIASHRIASHQLPTSQWPLYNKQTQLVCNSGGEDVDAAMAVIVVAEEEGGVWTAWPHAWIEAERSEERRGREMRGYGHGEAAHRSATLPIPHYSTPLPTPQTTLHATSLLITTPSSSPPSSNQPPSGHLTSRTFKLTQHHDAALRPEAGLELTRVRVAERANRLRHGGHSPPPLVFSSPSSHPPHPPHPSTHLLLPSSVQPLIHLPFPTQLHLYRVGAATPPLLSNLQSLPTSNFSQIQPRRIASHRIASHQLPTSQWPLYNKQTQLVCNSGGEDVDAAMAVIVVAEEEGGNRSATLPIPHYSTPLPTPQTTLHATSLLITTPSSSPPSSNQPPSGHLTSRTFKLTQHHDAALRPEAGLELTRVRVAERANRLRHGGHSSPPLVFSSPSSHPPHPPHPSTHLLLPSSVQPLIHLPFPTQLHLYRGGAATPPLLSNLQSLPTSNFSQIQPRRIASHRIASHQLPTSQWPLYNKQTQLVCNSGGEDVDAAMAVIVVAEEEGGNRSATLPIPHYSTPLPTPQTTLHATSLLITTPSSSPPSSNQPPSGHLTSRTFKLTQHHDAALRPEAGLELTRVRVAERANRLRHGGHSPPPLVFSSPSSHPPHPPHPSTHLLLPSSVQPLIHLPFPTQLHLYRGGAATPPLLSNLQSLPTSNFSQIQPRRIASHRIASHQLPTSQWPLYNKQTQLVCNSGGEDVDAAMAVIVVAEEEGGNRSATLPIPHYSTPLPTPQTTLHATSLLITTPSSSPPSSNQPPSGHLTSRTFKLTQHHDAALRPEAGLELTRVRVAERANRLRHGGHSPPPLVFSSPSSHPPHPPHPSTHLLLPSSVQPLIHLPFPTQLHLYRGGAATPPLLSNLQSLPTSNFSQIQPRRIASHRIASHQLPTSQWPLYNKQTQLVCNSGGEDVDAAMAVIVVAEEEGGSLDCLATCMD
ncbi:hypothetical protein Aperf_G00000030821 [Anoplocephala perfoliata]